MLIFIDDSGDPGFKFEKGSTRYFVVLLLIFDDETQSKKAITAINLLRQSLGFQNDVEFKFQKSSREVRMQFLEAINSCRFRTCTLVIDKTRAQNHLLVSTKNSLYDHAIQMALTYAQQSILDAKIWIDGDGGKTFGKSSMASLRKNLNTPQRKVIKQCKIVDSKGNVLIQMADMLAGAVRRSYSTSKSDCAIYKSIIKKHIEHEWLL